MQQKVIYQKHGTIRVLLQTMQILRTLAPAPHKLSKIVAHKLVKKEI